MVSNTLISKCSHVSLFLVLGMCKTVEIFVSQHGIGGNVAQHSFICKMINIKWSAVHVYFLPEITSVTEQMVKPQGHPN